jgi:hypothetical protein
MQPDFNLKVIVGRDIFKSYCLPLQAVNSQAVSITHALIAMLYLAIPEMKQTNEIAVGFTVDIAFDSPGTLITV